ncbi:hypothetical protein ACWDBD_36650 [Streptomyces sp. NPDC001118]
MGLVQTVQRGIPIVSALAVDVAAMVTDGWEIDAAVSAGWGLSMALLVPMARTSNVRLAYETLRELEPAESPELEASTEEEVDEDTRRLCAMWERAPVSGDTRLCHVTWHEPEGRDFSALIKALPGHAVPTMDERDVAAAFGVKPEAVKLLETSHGPGWMELIVTPDALERSLKGTQTDADWWARTIARDKGGAPGSVFTAKKEAAGVTHWFAQMPDESETIRGDIRKLCTAFGVSPDDMRLFVTEQGHKMLVSVFDESPLSMVVYASRDLITPNAEGFFRVGTTFDGRPVNGRLYHEGGAAHALLLGASGSGKTQLVIVYMAGDSLDGAVIWGAATTEDAKLRLVEPHVDRLGFGPLYMVRLLRAAVKLMEIRGRMGKRVGHDWLPGAADNVYRRLSLYLDEFNAACADPKYGEEITELAERVSIQGRKYGIGIKVSGQDGKVEDGMTTTMRNQLRQNGRQITLNVGDMDAVRRAFAGLIAAEDLPEPLPQEYGGSVLTLEEIAEGLEDPEDSEGIGGIGWVVRKGKPVLMRTLYVDLSGSDREQVVADLFAVEVFHLTEEEIRELGDLLGDWYAPDEDDEDDEDGGKGKKRSASKKNGKTTRTKAGFSRSVADRVSAFLEILPDADRDMVISGVADDDISPEDVAAAYDALTRA